MPLDEAKPFSKSEQLARGPKRPKRLVASKKRWGEIAKARQGPCVACGSPPPNQLHHLISRAQGGADCESNLASLCLICHQKVEAHDRAACKALVLALDDSQYAYCVEHGGESVFERRYHVKYEGP